MKNLKWGTKVRTTEKAIGKHIFPKHRRGICLRDDGSLSMTVVCEGQVTPSTYHPDFWTKAS